MLKFGLIGCGAIGSRHAAVLDAEPRAELTAICDIEKGRADSLCDLYGSKVAIYDDYHKLLDDPSIEVINICTPHGLHAEMAIAAARAGKHILVEKPMALHVADALEMIRVAEECGVKLMVVKQNRYNVPIALAKQAIEEGRLGKIFMCQCNLLWNRHDEYYQKSNWRGQKALEGGALFTQASHFIDLMIWWFGDVLDARATVETKNHDIEIEDCGNALLEFSSGVMGSLTWTTCVYNKNYEGSLTIIGEKGIIKIGGQYLNKIEYWDVMSHPLPEDIDFADQPNLYRKYQGTSSNHPMVVSDVVAKLLQERHNVVEGDEGLKSIEAIEMIYASVNDET